jgi:hypothetical protein
MIFPRTNPDDVVFSANFDHGTRRSECVLRRMSTASAGRIAILSLMIATITAVRSCALYSSSLSWPKIYDSVLQKSISEIY